MSRIKVLDSSKAEILDRRGWGVLAHVKYTLGASVEGEQSQIAKAVLESK